MKKLLLILLCLPMIGFGQEIYSEEEVEFNIAGKLRKETSATLTASLKKDNQPISGIVKTFWKSDRLRGEFIFEEGQIQSYTKYFNSKKGNKMSETIYKNGSIHSRKSYYPNGRLQKNKTID